MTRAETLTLVVSIISIIVATISWCISHHVNKRMLEIEEKREQDRLAEQNTGRVRIVVTQNPKQFLIYNEGNIGITITDIILDKISVSCHPCFQYHSFPRNGIKIPAKNHYPITMFFAIGMETKYLPPYDAIVKLVTDNGNEQQIQMSVNWV